MTLDVALCRYGLAGVRAVENQVCVAPVSLVGSHPLDAVGADGTRLGLARDDHAAATGSVDVGALAESRSSVTVRPYSDVEAFER